MPKAKTGFDLLADDQHDAEIPNQLNINKNYAANYAKWRRMEEMQKCAAFCQWAIGTPGYLSTWIKLTEFNLIFF